MRTSEPVDPRRRLDQRQGRRTGMLARLAVAGATLVVIVAACGSSPSPAPSSAASAPAASTGASAPAASAAASQAAASGSPGPTPITGTSTGKPGDVEIVWYCCLGTGDAPEQVKVEQQVADGFNSSHPGIHLSFQAYPYQGARDALSVLLGSGNGPDIVGPVGIGGANAFHGQWLDLQPLIDKNHYDMSQYPSSTVALYNVGGEGQVGIPYAIYPSELFYKKSLFKEAGLKEPPHQWGGTYTMPDGSVVPWDYDTARKIALLLTVDKKGKDATQDGFDPDQIVQWGFEPQRDDLRQVGAYWKSGSLVASDGKTAQIPDAWAASWKWFYDGIWKDHFSVTGPQFLNTDFNPDGYPFCTGKVAMSENYLWSLYCTPGAGTDWDIAATPSYQGQTTAAFNADTFRILKSSKHPDEAFAVLTYLLANQDLLTLYGGMPAVTSQQDTFFTTIQGQKDDKGNLLYPQKIDWNVAKEGVLHADVPNFESYTPAYNQMLDTINTFGTKWQATPGLDLDKEIADLKAQLQDVFDKGGS
jgi:multiple sugar transport system substrate-binding protein